jgi:hypothetical protein
MDDESALMERAMRTMQSGRFIVAPLPPEWRLVHPPPGNTVLRWRNGDASIQLYYYWNLSAAFVLRDIASTFEATADGDIRLTVPNYPTVPRSICGISGAGDPRYRVLAAYVAVPSATAADVIACGYMEQLSLDLLVRDSSDPDRVAMRSHGLAVFRHWLQGLRSLSVEQARELRSQFRE